MKNESSAELIEMIDPKSIGRNLKLMDVESLNVQTEKLESRWYQGLPGSDLFLWLNPEKVIIKQQLCICGFIVEWNCLEGLKTGIVIETNLSNQATETEPGPVSVNINYDSLADRFIVQLSLDTLRAFDSEEKLKLELISNFKNPQSIETLPAEDFIERFGATLRMMAKSQMSLWDHLKARLHNLFRSQ